MNKICLALLATLLCSTVANASSAADPQETGKSSNLTPQSFHLETYVKQGTGLCVVNTDLEPDDLEALAVLGVQLTLIAEQLDKKVDLAIIVGGANAHINLLRAERFIDCMKKDGFLKTVSIRLIRGASEVNKTYEEQGNDLLDEKDKEFCKNHKKQMAEFVAKNKEGEPSEEFAAYATHDIAEIQRLFSDAPQSIVFNLKPPVEFIGTPNILENLKKSIILTYAGAYNIEIPDWFQKAKKGAEYGAGFVAFLNAGQANADVNNALLIANASGGKRDITTTNTPEIVKRLEALEGRSATIRFLSNAIHNWNAKISWDFLKRTSKKAQGECGDGTKIDPATHYSAIEEIRAIFLELIANAEKTGNLYGQTIRLLDPSDAIYARARNAFSSLDSKDKEVGFRKAAFLAIQQEPKVQRVIADPLAVLLAVNPGLISTSDVGVGVKPRFVEADKTQKGRFVHFTSLTSKTGSDGKPESGILTFQRALIDQLVTPLESRCAEAKK